MSEIKPASKGIELIKAWQDAVACAERADLDKRRAECAEANARGALAKWLMPADAKPGEKFSIWHRDKDDREVLFEVACNPDGHNPTIRLRQRQ